MILLTGSTGTIGKKVNFDIDLDFHLPPSSSQLKSSENLFGNSTLIHLAGVSNTREVETNPTQSYLVNVKSTVVLFNAFAENHGKRFIFASTGHVYGGTTTGSQSAETDTLKPRSEYARQKMEAEFLLTETAEKYNTELLILRIFSIFGAGMRKSYLAGMIEKSIIETGQFPTVKNSDDVRDFSTPDQVASYINRSVLLKTEKITTLNICTGIGCSIRDKVIEVYPSIPISKFSKGTSDLPYLVGNPRRMNVFFNAN